MAIFIAQRIDGAGLLEAEFQIAGQNRDLGLQMMFRLPGHEPGRFRFPPGGDWVARVWYCNL